MTKNEFLEWKSDPRTQEILQGMKSQVGRMEYQIARSVGEDSKMDLIRRGYILAFEDVINIQFEETEEVSE